jgi:hypothetical protein
MTTPFSPSPSLPFRRHSVSSSWGEVLGAAAGVPFCLLQPTVGGAWGRREEADREEAGLQVVVGGRNRSNRGGGGLRGVNSVGAQ